METVKSEIQPIANWSAKATSQCMQLLANESVTKTSFDIKAKYENCYFGDIGIETTSSTTANVADLLKQIDEAVDIDFEPGKKSNRNASE